MEVKAIDLTYTELKTRLAQSLSRESIASSTLSRWMSALGYPKGTPGKRRHWDGEDLMFIGFYAAALELNRCSSQAKSYAQNQLRKFRGGHACNG